MLSIAHATTGAFIAVKISNPFLAIPLILLSHYIEDAIPHWDTGTGLTNGSKTARSAFLHELPDLFLAGVLILALFQFGKPLDLSTAGLAPYWGGFFALLPDFMEAPRNFLKKDLALLKPFNDFHHKVHKSIPRPVAGLAPQIIVLILIFLFR